MGRYLIISFGLFVLVCNCIAQNYQPIKSTTQYFFRNDTGAFNGIRIDSVAIESTDTAFFNYTTLGYDSSSSCYDLKAPTWLGAKILYQGNGNCYFFTKTGDSVLIKSKAIQGEEWTVFNYANGQKIKAKIDTIVLDSVMGILDSVKTISFRLVDLNDAPLASDWNGGTIKLGQTFGLIAGFDFYQFPTDTTRYYIVGCQNPILGVHLPTWGELYNLSVGDEFIYSQSNSNSYYVQVPHNTPWGVQYSYEWTSAGEQYYFKNIVYQIDTTADSIKVVFLEMTPNGGQYYVDTVSVIESANELFYTEFPNEFKLVNPGEINEIGFLSTFYLDTILCGNSIFVSYNDTLSIDFWFSPLDSNCFGQFQPFESTSYGNHKLGIDFGFYSESANSSWNYGSYDEIGASSGQTTLVYFKKGSNECGPPISESIILGTEIRSPNQFEIYPNPTTGIIHFQNILGLEEISVYDVMGKVIWNGKPQRKQIDLSGLENGIYTLRTATGNAAKVVVQR